MKNFEFLEFISFNISANIRICNSLFRIIIPTEFLSFCTEPVNSMKSFE